MIFVKSILAGLAAVIVVTLIVYALAVGVPRFLDLIRTAKVACSCTAWVLFQYGRLESSFFSFFLWRLLLGFPASPTPALEREIARCVDNGTSSTYSFNEVN